MSFMSRIVLLDPKLTPMSISAIFKWRKICSFCKFLGRLNKKKAAAQVSLWTDRGIALFLNEVVGSECV